MKNLIYLFLFLPVNFIVAQSSWFFQNPFYTQSNILNIQVLTSDTGYATGEDGAILKITRRGNTWSNVYSNITTDIKSHFFLNSQTGYCIADRKLNNTINGGTNWTIVQTGFTDDLTSVLFINSDTGFVTGAYGKVLKTTNGGINWSVKDLNTPLFISKIIYLDMNTGYCTAGSSIYKTIDCGENWSLQNTNTFKVIHSIYFVDQVIGYACGANGLILKTTNGGANWQSTNIQNDINFFSVKFINSNTGYCAGNLWNVATIFKTTNSGNNWLPQFVPSFDTLRSLWIFDSLNVIAAGNNGAITRSIDTQNWIPISSITEAALSSMYFPSENTGYCVGYEAFDFINNNSHGTIMKTSNSGNNWNMISVENNCDFYDVHFLNDNTGFVAGDSTKSIGTIFKTTDGGDNWIRTAFQDRSINKIYFIDENRGFACGNENIIYGVIMGTTDGGDQWFDVKNYKEFAMSSVFFLDELNGFGVGNRGDFGGIFLRTTNGGKEWSDLTISGAGLYSVFFINPSTGYAAGDQVILKTTDSGNNWSEQFFGGLRHLKSIYFTNNLTGYCIGDKGKLLQTSNSGDTWITQNSIVHENLTCVYFKNANTGYIVGNRGSMIKTINGGSVSINETETIIPDNYILYQNFPNPFNPTTNINYKLKSAGYVSLKVFDMLGKEVSILVNEKQSSGDYSVNFNGTNLASGIYIYRLEAGDFLDGKMMVLIK